jgi:hypothetical protein
MSFPGTENQHLMITKEVHKSWPVEDKILEQDSESYRAFDVGLGPMLEQKLSQHVEDFESKREIGNDFYQVLIH